jgi:hypothetical protein
MTYSSGGKIQATDYNGFVSTGVPNFNNIWSTGSTNSGYGQTALATVSAGNKVTATNFWNSLVANIASSAAHQGTTITAITPPVAGNKVAFLSALSTNLGAINTGRLNCSAVGTDITGSGTRTTAWGTGQSIPSVTSTVTVTFASANAARYFFNAGGQILVSTNKTTGSGTPEDVAWINLCADIGTIGLPAVSTAQTLVAASYTGLTKFGGGGSAPVTYVRNGFYDLTSTPTIYFKQFGNTGVYTSDYIQILYSVSGAVVTISGVFLDTSSFFANTVTGNLTVTAIARPPSTTNLTNSWGTPTVNVTAPA